MTVNGGLQNGHRTPDPKGNPTMTIYLPESMVTEFPQRELHSWANVCFSKTHFLHWARTRVTKKRINLVRCGCGRALLKV